MEIVQMVFAGGNGDPRDGADDAPLVLVIEDEPTQRTMLMRVLEREGYRAIGLADGETGMRAIVE
ncbi:MAG TPA: hypothetical protein VJ754_00545, partial [Anaerolineae bacterium]|nr:hypothetical protein [Anaerolineae bacterium]